MNKPGGSSSSLSTVFAFVAVVLVVAGAVAALVLPLLEAVFSFV